MVLRCAFRVRALGEYTWSAVAARRHALYHDMLG